MSLRYKVMCGCKCYISSKSIHSSLLSWRDCYFKKTRISAKILKTEGLGEKKIAYIKHIKIQSCHMRVTFTPKHKACQRQKCVHTHSQTIFYHTGNLYCGVVLNVHMAILITNKQIKNMNKQHPQLCFTFIT